MAALTSIQRIRFEKFLVYIGCKLKRTAGDHLIYDRPSLKRPVVITADRDVPIFTIRNNLRTLGLGVEEYLEILKKV